MDKHEYAWTRAGRMYWNLRNRLGQFCTREGKTRSRLEELHEAWLSYLYARRERADEATKGKLLSMLGRRRRHLCPETFFTPGHPGRSVLMSEELSDWFEANGRTLTRREFVRQAA